MPVTLKELAPTELDSIYPLILELNLPLNPGFNRKRFDRLLEQMRMQGYRCLGAYDGTNMIGICGFTITARFWCGRQLDLDNFIVTQKYQNRGIGDRMLQWFDRLAKKEQCDVIVLDSYAASHAAHRFYFRAGYIIKGYHFYKEVA